MTYETDYGYWIAPDGSVLAVCLCEHEAYKGYEEADEEGWIRMVVIPEEDSSEDSATYHTRQSRAHCLYGCL
jgi:hypothetical protein